MYLFILCTIAHLWPAVLQQRKYYKNIKLRNNINQKMNQKLYTKIKTQKIKKIQLKKPNECQENEKVKRLI